MTTTTHRKTVMTSFDLMAIVKELNNILPGKTVDNVYEIDRKIFLLKLRPGSLQLLIELERRIHLTKYVLQHPQTPPHFCMELRKSLRGAQIRRVSQQGLERVVELGLRSWRGEVDLIIEVFKRGNLILLDQDRKIICASKYLEMKDRVIARKGRFTPLKSSGIHPETLRLIDLSRLKSQNPHQPVFTALLSILPYPPLYIDEVLLEAGVDGKMEVEMLREGDEKKIVEAVKTIYLQHLHRSSPVIVWEDELQVDVLPLPLRVHESRRVESYSSYNEAADDYFSRAYLEDLRKKKSPQEEKIEELRRILTTQLKEKHKMEGKIELQIQLGEILKKNVLSINPIIKELEAFTIKGGNLKELVGKKGILEVVPEKKMVKVSVGQHDCWIRFDKSAYWNAGSHYERSKRLKRKLEGLMNSIKRNREQLKALESAIKISEAKPQVLKVRRKREWYEKFRWFVSSEGFMVLIGKDASTNSLLIEKYTGSDDIVFHADVYGAPFVVVKTEGKHPGEATFTEASIAAASYSRAWSQGFSSCDVYWVKPDQLSRRPPPGEYLKRGMYMIYGRRNYLRRVPLDLAIGCKSDGAVEVVGGPTSAVRNQTALYVKIIPGNISSGRLAKNVLNLLIKKSPEDLLKKVREIEVDMIQNFIPSGKGDIEKEG